jgi:hypothetical protein
MVGRMRSCAGLSSMGDLKYSFMVRLIFSVFRFRINQRLVRIMCMHLRCCYAAFADVFLAVCWACWPGENGSVLCRCRSQRLCGLVVFLLWATVSSMGDLNCICMVRPHLERIPDCNCGSLMPP